MILFLKILILFTLCDISCSARDSICLHGNQAIRSDQQRRVVVALILGQKDWVYLSAPMPRMKSNRTFPRLKQLAGLKVTPAGFTITVLESHNLLVIWSRLVALLR